MKRAKGVLEIYVPRGVHIKVNALPVEALLRCGSSLYWQDIRESRRRKGNRRIECRDRKALLTALDLELEE